MNSKTLISELKFKALRSSGAGGQHVNKVSSKIELQFNLETSEAFTEEEKELLAKNLTKRLTKDSRLVLQCDDTRSQHKNKEIIIKRFFKLIETNLIEEKERKVTKIPKVVIKKRLENKKQHATKKANRKKPDLE